MKKKECVTLISCGDKYNSFLLESIRSDVEFQKMMQDLDLIITTDDPEFFNGCGASNIFSFEPEFLKDVRKGRKKTWFNFNQKRLAIENAHKLGYEKIFYIDSDIKIWEWQKDFFIKNNTGFTFRRLLTKENHEEKYNFYSKLYNVDLWHYWRPVSEKIMLVNEHPHKLQGFLKVWEHLDDLAKGKVNPFTEGNEILIALRFNGCNVHTYNPDPFKSKERMSDNFGKGGR